MTRHRPFPLLVVGSFIVAGLCTLTVDGGWLVWIPVLPAIIVVNNLKDKLKV
jgi:hypothetical protein